MRSIKMFLTSELGFTLLLFPEAVIVAQVTRQWLQRQQE
jgi:hypothetical protein